jgi:L-asparagine transporter-like permease
MFKKIIRTIWIISGVTLPGLVLSYVIPKNIILIIMGICGLSFIICFIILLYITREIK